MEEIIELKAHLLHGRYPEAMLLLDDMEEMAKEDKLNKIRSFCIVLLLHLIKQQAEGRSTRSWDYSILNAVDEIKHINKRRKSGGNYASSDELQEMIVSATNPAMKYASLGVFEGTFTAEQLAEKIDISFLQNKALQLLVS